jgi:methylated-DNA-[protein]-cysteine S-methyltransferase
MPTTAPVVDRFALVASPVGELLLTGDGRALAGCWFTEPGTVPPRAAGLRRDDDAFAEPIRQLEEYFDRRRTEFDLELAPAGTEFQLRVWAQLRTIPYGATCSYADVARGIGATNGFRAVGLANGRNPISIIVPCHRVIGADGSLTGYGGGMERKRFLLDLESGSLPFG